MTTQNEVSSASRPRATFLVPFLVLVIAGLLLWQFGIFKSRPRVAIVTSGDTPYWDTIIAGAQEAARVYDVDLTVVRSKTDAETQSLAIRDLLAKGTYAGVAISPVSPLAQAAVLADVAGHSTLVTLDSDSPVARRLCFVGTDNYHSGRMLGELVKENAQSGGEIIICIGNAEKDNTQRRRQGLIDELLDRTDEPERPNEAFDAPIKGAKYTIVETLVDGSDPAKSTELAIEAIKKYPNVKCFAGLLSYSAPALVKALEATQKLDKIQIVGFDASNETLAAIEAGHVAATIMQDQFGCGFETVRILAENSRGESGGLPMFQRRTLPCEQVTKDNVGTIRSQLSFAASAANASK